MAAGRSLQPIGAYAPVGGGRVEFQSFLVVILGALILEQGAVQFTLPNNRTECAWLQVFVHRDRDCNRAI